MNIPNMMLFTDNLDRFLSEAKRYENIMWSPKIDGVRCWAIVDENIITYISRNKKQFKNFGVFDSEIRKISDVLIDRFDLKYPLIIDGEVSTEDKSFRKVMTQTQRIKNVNVDKLIFYIFELVDDNKPFYVRHKLIAKSLANTSNKKVVLLPYYDFKGKSKDDISDLMNEWIDKGYEGIMLRVKNSKYEYKRSYLGCKIKKWHRMDVEVIGVMKGKGRNKDRLGALICVTKKGRKIKVGTGFTDKEREQFIKNPPQKIEISYKEEFPSGLLREPRFELPKYI